MKTYYNEIDLYAAQWLRNLIKVGQIALGDVDERSILDVTPTDLDGYDRCHFFAGIAGWDYALQLAGWPQELPVWTGSCPCQPFSAAGRGGKGTDERHLWPAWFHLIRVCRPAIIFGEQVASKDGLKWLDLVCTDLEAEGYAVGAADLCAASVGAPHIRQRLWFVAHTGRWEQRQCSNTDKVPHRWHCEEGSADKISGSSPTGSMENPGGSRPRDHHREATDQGGAALQPGRKGLRQGDWEVMPNGSDSTSPSGELANSSNSGFSIWNDAGEKWDMGRKRRKTKDAVSCFSACEWLPCRDGKVRPTEPGIFPLAHGVQARVGRLRAYGNAIVPQVAAKFIRAFMEVMPMR